MLWECWIAGRAALGSEWEPGRVLQPDECPDAPVVPQYAKRLGLLLAALDHLHRTRRQYRQRISKRGHFMERHQSKSAH
jgi:hypothetical protein